MTMELIYIKVIGEFKMYLNYKMLKAIASVR